jgi:hypothetical protein
LTKYSTVYNNWKTGECKDIKPLPPKSDSFAVYELRFEGESKSEKYGAPLMTALDAWMHGRALEKPVQKWFPFSMPKPSVAPDFIDKAIARYEHRRDKAFNEEYPVGGCAFSKYAWIGGKPIVVRRGKATFIEWTYMGEMFSMKVPEKGANTEKSAPNAKGASTANPTKEAEKAAQSLTRMCAYADGDTSDYNAKGCGSPDNSQIAIPEWLFRAVRGKGLAKRI